MKQFGEIEGMKVLITDHALARMVEMKMTAEEIRLLLCDPTEVYSSHKYAEAINHRRGKHALCMRKTDAGLLIIVTALWSSRLAWLDAYKTGLLSADRELDFERLKGLPMAH